MKFMKRDQLKKHAQLCALGRPGQEVALRHLNGLRADKMDKPSVALVSLQKSGSTLLSYCCVLLNTGNQIQRFRNDFDLLPMLSFPASIIPQNFNARQDGIYQMYKINGHLERMMDPLSSAGVGNVLWMSREFSGYYASVFRWLKTFYCRVNPELAPLSRLEWEQYKEATFEMAANDHIDELWKAFQCSDDRVFKLTYEHLTDEKERSLARIAEWLNIPHDPDMLSSIAQKTSKQAMSDGERFDPLAFGEGGGVSKVNLQEHPHVLSTSEQAQYDELFAEKFSAAGLTSYRDLINELEG